MSEILVERNGAVTIVTLNRPERHNALSPALMDQLSAAVTEFGDDADQRVMILTGAGEKAFCSGADLKMMQQRNENPEEAARQGRKRRLPVSPQPDICGVAACEKPIIAAINGLAIGGGLELSLCCDIRLCADDAWFGLPEPARGFLAGVAVVVLPRLMPFGVVMDMMLAGERLTAADAHRWGLVQAVAKREDLIGAAMRRADVMAKYSPSALWGTKRVLRYWRDLTMAEHQRYYEANVHRVLLAGDMFEGVKAFSEKREPKFSPGWADPMSRK